MRRVPVNPRHNWQWTLESQGMTYHTFGNAPSEVEGVYWDESVAYEFTLAEITEIEDATDSLYKACLATVANILGRPEWREILRNQFLVPDIFHDAIQNSWSSNDPSIMARFDLALSRDGVPPKMLEINGDTPTLVIETALVQWRWLEETHGSLDQFNSLHEKILLAYGSLRARLPQGSTVVFSSLDEDEYPEEFRHAQYFQDLANQAGISTSYCAIRDVGWDAANLCFVDTLNNPIRFWSKLYPWEWLIKEPFGENLIQSLPRVGTLEPPWKILLSSKAILPWLSYLYPDHPNLLPASFERGAIGPDAISKPVWGREGANMMLTLDGTNTQTGGSYGDTLMVYQQAVHLPCFDGNFIVAGSWIADDRPAGMIIREDTQRIIVNTSKVVPHYIKD